MHQCEAIAPAVRVGAGRDQGGRHGARRSPGAAPRELAARARADERRRLREDVHDRVGPLLAGLGLGLAALRTTIHADADAAERQLDELRAQVHDALAEVRRVVDVLAPLAVEQRGLGPALDAFARRCDQAGGPAVHVDADLAGPLPGDVAATAYEIALEAIGNAIRHADADHVDVVLRRSPTALELTVADDGRGIVAPAAHGIGLRSMRRRAERLGGGFAIETRPGGGTRVRARLPLTAGRRPR